MKWLGRYWAHLQGELNKVNGAAAVGGLGLAGASFFSEGKARLALIIVSLLLLAPIILIAMWRAIPPKVKSPADSVGRELHIADFRSIEPPISGVGIIGREKAGKSLLKNYLLFNPEKPDTTQAVTARVTTTIEHPDTYLAILDGQVTLSPSSLR